MENYNKYESVRKNHKSSVKIIGTVVNQQKLNRQL